MRIRAPWRVAAATATLALTAAACSGGGSIEDTSPADADQAADEASATDDDPASDDGASDDEGGASGGGLSADLLGAGASFPDPIYQTWIGEFTQNVEPEVSIQYESIGSGGGREQLIGQQVAFAGTDAAMDDDEIADAVAERGCGDVVHVPTVFGGVVIGYNIDGLEGLVLDATTIAAIFAGDITNANDPAIAALNEGVELPDQDLTPVVRADSSGTTSIFTTYLEDEVPAWADAYGSGSEITWFDGVVAGEQNDGVQAGIVSQPGGIGYLSLEYAVAAGLPFADVVNADGTAVTPSTESVSAAVDGLDLPEDLRFDVLGVGGEGYPIAGATWVLAYTCGYDEADADALKGFLTWAIENGDDDAASLGYAPLSDATQELSQAKIDLINSEG